jgi:hypothetical protein
MGSTPIDVMVLADTGIPVRADLTAACAHSVTDYVLCTTGENIISERLLHPKANVFRQPADSMGPTP